MQSPSRSAPSDGHGCSKLIDSQRTPDPTCETVEERICRAKDFIKQVLHHPDFDPAEVDHDMHERLMTAIEAGNIEVIDLWE